MKRAVGLQALASLLMLFPLLFLNVANFAGNTDALFYTVILRTLGSHIALGDFHPLWLAEANGGVGSPALIYYSPLSYYLTTLIGFPFRELDPYGWKRLALGMFIAQWLGGIAAYAWLKRRISEKPALAASLLFTMFPYKFVYIFLHINLAQIWALAFLPLLMIAAEDIAAAKPRAIAWYALWIGLLALTHPRTLVAFAALPGLYALIFARNKKYAIGQLLIAHVLGLGLAALYVLPAALNLNLVQADLANMGRMDYATNLSHKDVALNFHYAIIAALITGLLSRLPALRASRAGKEAWFYIAAIAVVAFLCLRISQPLWDVLPMLQFLQFPAARLHAPALIAATALAGFLFEHARDIPKPRWLYSPVVLLLLVAAMGVWTLCYIGNIYAATDDIGWAYIEDMERFNVILPSEYRTRWQHGYKTIEDMSDATDRPLVQVMSGNGEVGSSFENPRLIHLKARIAEGGAALHVRQLYLPEWNIPDVKIVNDPQGMIAFFLPPGEHDLKLTLGSFPGESEGLVISIASLILIAILYRRQRQRI